MSPFAAAVTGSSEAAVAVGRSDFFSWVSMGIDAADDDERLVDEMARLMHAFIAAGSSRMVCTPLSSDDEEDDEAHSSRLFNDLPVIVHAEIFACVMLELSSTFLARIACL